MAAAELLSGGSRRKARARGRERGVLHVLTDPDPTTAGYCRERTLKTGDEVLLPNGIRLSAADLLPP